MKYFEEIRAEMERNEIDGHVLVIGHRGSVAHGTTTNQGLDDVDVFAVWVGSYYRYVGLGDYDKTDHFNTNGQDLDIEGFELRKFCRLLLKSNPNVHSYLWTNATVRDWSWMRLVEIREKLLSQKILLAIRGYVEKQLELMDRDCKNRYMGTRREELRRRYGYDIKAAAHALRLLRQGIGIAVRHELAVRVEGPDLDDIMAVKQGLVPRHNFVRLIEAAQKELEAVAKYSSLPELPDAKLLHATLVEMMREHHGVVA